MGLHFDFGQKWNKLHIQMLVLEVLVGGCILFRQSPVLCLAVSELTYVSDIELLILLASKHQTIPVILSYFQMN